MSACERVVRGLQNCSRRVAKTPTGVGISETWFDAQAFLDCNKQGLDLNETMSHC